jgi:hypothetical protein
MSRRASSRRPLAAAEGCLSRLSDDGGVLIVSSRWLDRPSDRADTRPVRAGTAGRGSGFFVARAPRGGAGAGLAARFDRRLFVPARLPGARVVVRDAFATRVFRLAMARSFLGLDSFR